MPTRTLVALSMLAAVLCAQSTLHVPNQYPTIQSAVDAAVAGDTVLVDPGNYVENIDIDKAIEVRSVGGPEVTALAYDVAAPGDVARVREGATLDGFRVHSGFGMGALAPAVVRNCIIENHMDTGLSVVGLIPNFNTGIVVVHDCVIRNNTGMPGVDGQAMYCPFGSGPTCTSPPGPGRTGGVSVFGDAYLINCMIVDNVKGDDGALPYPCQLYQTYAGGVHLAGDDATLIHCTIAGNLGPGVHAGFSGGSLLQSSVVWGNTLWPGQFASWAVESGGERPFFSYCDVQNLHPLYSNRFMTIDADPLFVDAANGDYRLSAGSPCIDASIGEIFSGFYKTDFEGNPRIVGANSDMGADEFVAPLVGTEEGLDLTTTVDGLGAALDAKVALAGAALVAELVNPAGNLAGAQPMLWGQVFLNPPTGIPFMGLHLDPFHIAVFHDGTVNPGPPIGPTPIVFGPAIVPPGLDGLILRLQAFTMTPQAVNGIYASSRAIDHHFVD